MTQPLSVAPHPVRLAISPVPAHVRTARLIAVAVAREYGINDDLLDEMRLAVGEACTHAVSAHQRAGSFDLIDLEFAYTPGDAGSATENRFTITVLDRASDLAGGEQADTVLTLLSTSDEFTEGFGAGQVEHTAAVELALIWQLAHTVDVTPLATGGVAVAMTWVV